MSSNPSPTVAYAVVAKDEGNEFEMANVELDNVELASPNVHQPQGEFSHLPEARNLAWNDDFFTDDDDVVAVFDFEYEAMESYYTSLGYMAYGSTIFCPTFMWLGCALGVPCFLHKNVEWSVRSQHVAVTRDGVRFVQERRQTCWGQTCTDAGKMSKTIPFDQITDCDILEPAGNTCIVIPNTLHTVHIDTASLHKSKRHELSLAGLRNPHAFKKLVWAMKRSMYGRAPPPAETQADTGAVAELLREIRDELRVNNEALLDMRATQAPPPANII